ncbi:hypothetical protein DRQ09_04410 [candidate division KSB1 bacterium]|nr:MAG: hypothetical protein DRQ09_04410 [candidate division KSB1 bacterium]
MKRITFILFISLTIIFLLAGICFSQKADLVLKNGKIITIYKERPRVEAVAIKGEKIIAVGYNSEIEKFIDPATTKVIDLEGKMACPGFNDAHIHFISGGFSLISLDLRNIASLKKIQQLVKERVDKAKPGEWITGRGWDHSLFPGGKWPTREILDEVSPNNPVMLTRVDGHSCWVNSKALEVSGITKDTPDPHAGKIDKDPVTGEPTGILRESAQGLLKMPRMYTRENTMNAIKLALEHARKLGVTSIQHLNGGFGYFDELRKKGELTFRVSVNMAWTDNPARLREYKKLKEKYHDHWIRFGYLKGFMDGSLGSGTAALFWPYNDDPTTTGLPTMTQADVIERVCLLDKEGFQIGIHAIGTRGNNMILNAYEEAIKRNGRRDSRHRSEHSQHLIPSDVDRFYKLGVIASMQPTHCITDKRFAEQRLGKERCRYSYAWRSLLNAGVHVAFGTDWPVEPVNPMEGLYAAVTRKDRKGEPGNGWFPEEKLTMMEAIELYTLGSAYATFEENIKGSIEPGKLADIVVLSKDLMTIPEDQIMKTEVVYTIVGGKIVYEKKD